MLLTLISFSAVFFTYTFYSQKNEIVQSLSLEANSIAKMLVYINSDAIVLNDGSFLVEFNYSFLQENKMVHSIILTNKHNKYVVSKAGWSLEEKIPFHFEALEKKDVAYAILDSSIVEKEVFHYVYPLAFSGTHWGWLHLSLSLDEYERKIEALYVEFLKIFLLFLVLIIALSYLLARKISRPIVNLNKITKRIARGHLELRSEHQEDDEIGELSDSFNTMISQIHQSQKALQKSHEELEERVKERTLKLHESNQKLEELNQQLDEKVKIEVEKRTKQEGLLIQQSRLAAMGEMLNNIAHQWRQPLSVITTASSGMKLEKELGCSDEEMELDKLDTIIKTANYLSNTINDFSNFFKPNKTRVSFCLKDKVEQALDLVGSSFVFHHIEVDKNYEGENKVYGFPNECSQAILNILTNAKDALISRKIEYPHINISVFERNDYGCLQIEDNAGGIPEEIIGKIFDPYFTTKHQSQGTGIGLYMSKMIIESNMNGKLEVYNGKEGAVFTILIPII